MNDKLVRANKLGRWMHEHAKYYDLAQEADQMYLAGLLCAVGAIRGPEADIGVASEDILRMTGINQMYLTMVRWQDKSDVEYCKYFGIACPADAPDYMKLFWAARENVE